MHHINTMPELKANARTHRLSMANTSDNSTKRRKNNAQNEIKYIHTKFMGQIPRSTERISS